MTPRFTWLQNTFPASGTILRPQTQCQIVWKKKMIISARVSCLKKALTGVWWGVSLHRCPLRCNGCDSEIFLLQKTGQALHPVMQGDQPLLLLTLILKSYKHNFTGSKIAVVFGILRCHPEVTVTVPHFQIPFGYSLT